MYGNKCQKGRNPEDILLDYWKLKFISCEWAQRSWRSVRCQSLVDISWNQAYQGHGEVPLGFKVRKLPRTLQLGIKAPAHCFVKFLSSGSTVTQDASEENNVIHNMSLFLPDIFPVDSIISSFPSGFEKINK